VFNAIFQLYRAESHCTYKLVEYQSVLEWSIDGRKQSLCWLKIQNGSHNIPYRKLNICAFKKLFQIFSVQLTSLKNAETPHHWMVPLFLCLLVEKCKWAPLYAM